MGHRTEGIHAERERTGAGIGCPSCSPFWLVASARHGCSTGVVDVVEPLTVTVVVNTGDDMVLHGLHISPDLDTVTYTLAGLDNQVTGWGMVGETWTTITELEALGGETWFRLGDRDLATHLYRTQRLTEGATLSDVTAELTARRGVGGATAAHVRRPGAHPYRAGRGRRA